MQKLEELIQVSTRIKNTMETIQFSVYFDPNKVATADGYETIDVDVAKLKQLIIEVTKPAQTI